MDHAAPSAANDLVNQRRKFVPRYIASFVGFYVAAVLTAYLGASVYLLSPFRTQVFSIALVAPVFLLCYGFWLQARRHLELAVEILRFRDDSYILYLRGSDADDDPRHIGFEDALVGALAPIGPTLIVDRFMFWKRSAAIQVGPFPDSVVWTEEVGKLADHAKLVVLRLGPRRGYRSDQLPSSNQPTFSRGELDGVWLELEQMPVKRFNESCLLFIGQHWDNRSLNATNANGSLYFGQTSVLAEIPRCLPSESSESWPPKWTPPSRWIWFQSEGRPLALGPPDWQNARLNGIARISSEVSSVLQRFGRRGHALRAGCRLLGIVSIATAVTFAYSFVRTVHEQPLAFALCSAIAVLATLLGLLIHHKLLFIEFLHYRYGEYENFVRPMYLYTLNLSRPRRRQEP